MLKKFLIAVVLIIAGICLFALTRPAEYTVDRMTVIDAPPARVYAIVDDFHNLPKWSPWQKLDPAMQTTYTGAARGVGAGYQWSGNDQVGKGAMKILESQPDRRVGMDLQFFEPFASQARTDIDIAPQGEGSQVTWTIRGHNNYLMKLMTVFVSMDAMMGKDFEEGLANLKRLAENRQ